jgi:hypothetical protein
LPIILCLLMMLMLLLPPQQQQQHLQQQQLQRALAKMMYALKQNAVSLMHRNSSLCLAWLCSSKLTMLKAILTPIKCIQGRVRFFENLIRSRCFFCSH